MMSRATVCPTCGSNDVVAISMAMEGVSVLFRACHVCEERWWEKDGAQVHLTDVLNIVR